MELPRDHILRPGALIRIGDFTIDSSRQSIRRDGDAQPLTLHRGSLDLLLALAERTGAVVSKEELLAAVWPGRVVSENSLQQAIRKLRLALGDDRGEMIQLVRGFGYRLALPVRLDGGERPESPRAAPAVAVAPTEGESADHIQTRPPTLPRVNRPRARVIGLTTAIALLLAAGATALVGVSTRVRDPGLVTTEERKVQEFRNTLAVLPFVDRSPDGALSREALLLADGLRRDSHRLPQLHSTSVGKVRAFASDPEDAVAVLDALDADLVISGELTPDPRGFELRIRLTDHSGQGLGFERRYLHASGNLAQLQSRLRFDLYKQLGNTPGRWAHDPVRGRGTTNREAWLAFLRAATLLGDDAAGQRRAKAALEQAVALDPNYADAWIALGSLLGAGGGAGGTYADDAVELAEGRRRAMAALDRGISLAPNEPSYYLLRSEIRHLYFYDWEGAEADLDRAESLMEKPTAHLYIQRARLAAARGDLAAALDFDDRATGLDPESGSVGNKAWHLIAMGNCVLARELLLQELAVRPFESSLNFYLGLCDIHDGLPEVALTRFEQAGTVHRLTGTILAQVKLGDTDAARRTLRSLEQRFSDSAAYEIGLAHAWLGEPEQAFGWLDRAIEGGDGGVLYLGFDPLAEPLRREPGYTVLLRRIKHPAAG